MNRLPVIKNFGRFSFVVDLFSWAVLINYDRYPGAKGWTHRVRILCFCFYYHHELAKYHSYDPYELDNYYDDDEIDELFDDSRIAKD